MDLGAHVREAVLEVFERMRDTSKAFAACNRSTYAVGPFKRLLAAASTQLQGDDRDAYYARALALVSTLTAGPQGRKALSVLLNAQRQQTCVPVDLSKRLDALWPGSLAGLANH